MTQLTNAPTLETERLILRGPMHEDFEPLADFFTDEQRAWGFGGAMDRNNAWRWFASNIGHWHLHGYGYWTVIHKETGHNCGITGIWNPEGWPEPEIGWVAFAGFEGKGIVHEAAIAVRDHAYRVWNMPALTSNIIPGNTRSIALAERLGCSYERTYNSVSHGETLMYRHIAPDQVRATIRKETSNE